MKLLYTLIILSAFFIGCDYAPTEHSHDHEHTHDYTYEHTHDGIVHDHEFIEHDHDYSDSEHSHDHEHTHDYTYEHTHDGIVHEHEFIEHDHDYSDSEHTHDDYVEIYEFNLAFTEDTDNSDTITLTWTENAAITVFNIEIDGEIGTASEEGQYTFPLLPGNFKDVIITAVNVLSETIKVFSSPMAPSTWQPNFVGNIQVTESFNDDGIPTNQFEWIPSIETDIISVQLQKCGYGNSPIECSELSNFSLIESFDSENSTYSETKNFGEKSCYIINSTDLTGNSRFSQIICNDLTPNAMLDVTITSISINLDNKISLEWTEYSESDFYQYTLYRSENEGMDNDSRIVLAEIIDANQTVFEDRNNIGFGQTWYYQIEVHNKYGRTSESNIIHGRSNP